MQIEFLNTGTDASGNTLRVSTYPDNLYIGFIRKEGEHYAFTPGHVNRKRVTLTADVLRKIAVKLEMLNDRN